MYFKCGDLNSFEVQFNFYIIFVVFIKEDDFEVSLYFYFFFVIFFVGWGVSGFFNYIFDFGDSQCWEDVEDYCILFLFERRVILWVIVFRQKWS